MAKGHVETDLVTLGRDPERFAGAVNVPVFRTSTVLFETVAAMDAASAARALAAPSTSPLTISGSEIELSTKSWYFSGLAN